MSNIDKLKAAAAKAVDNFDPNMFMETRAVLALLDELDFATEACNGWHRKFAEADERLEAAEKRVAALTESLKQTVSGYKSCLRTGHDRILDLGGDCDEPEVMISGNPDIQQAEKLLAAAAGKGDAS